MHPRIVVLAAGNRSRGDDAIGPLLLARLESWLAAQGRGGEFELIDDYQLQIEHALDLRGRKLALFIDAGWHTPAPFVFYAADAASAPATLNTHELSPQAVLDVYRKVELAAPPPAFVLCTRGERFELGEGLSRAGEGHLETAWQRLAQLCGRPDATRWRTLVTAD